MAAKVVHARTGRAGRRRLRRQARRARAVARAGPGVVAPLGMTEVEGRAVSVWPWLPGRDLASRLARHGSPDPDWGRRMADDLRSIGADLTRRGVAHGAIQLEHVLLDDEGRPHLGGLEPAARGDPTTLAADARAVARICDRLVGGGRDDPPRWDAGQSGSSGARRLLRAGRGWRPLVAAVAVTISVAALAVAGAGRSGGCEPMVGPPGRVVDVDGDGCDDRLRWSTATGRLTAVTAGGRRAWQLGTAGDRFLLADWDCDGGLTPGLHRPSTGRTYAFDAWPTTHPIEARPVTGPSPCPAARR